MDSSKIIECGKSLGLSGQDLIDYVEKKENDRTDREERLAERDHQRRSVELESELKLQEMRLESQRLSTQSNVSSDSSVPRIPCFKESECDIQSYLERFERYAKGLNWDPTCHAFRLGNLLTGKALLTYSSLPVTIANDYSLLKAALLECYQLSYQDLKRKFYTAKMQENESGIQYMEQLRQYLNSWRALAEVDTTYKGIFNMILQAQFIHSCPPDLSVFLKQQGPADLQSMAEMSNNFLLAASRTAPQSARYRTPGRSYMVRSQFDRFAGGTPRHNPYRPTGYRGDNPYNRPFRGNRFPTPQAGLCFLCNTPGHYQNQCRERVPMNSPRMSNAGRSSHLGNAAVSPNTIAETRGLSHHDTSCPRSTNFKCGCVAPTFGNACIRDCRNLKVHHGYIDSTPVDVLRDTGCSSVIVRASLVDDSQLTGEQHLLYMIDNSVLHVPTAICHIRTPFFSGEVEVLCLQNPVCDLILGNIENIQEEDVNFDCLHTVEQTSNSKQVPNASGSSICTQTCPLESIDNKVGCVATRSQAKVRDRPLKPLIVPSQIDTSISVESFREAQINDPSLNKFFYLADREFPEESRDALTHWFVVENGLLYRVFK